MILARYRFVFGLLIPLSLCLAAVAQATTQGTGAGPEDVYGGSAENKNYCTPYHILQPGEVEDKKYEFKRPYDIRVLDKEHYQYWTKGNNISRSTTISGLHVQVTDWQQGAIGAEFPRGSSFQIFRSAALTMTCFGEFNGKEPKDTVITKYIGGSQMGGKIPEDQSYRDDLDFVGKQGNTWGVHVSTREGDLADWPDEFSDENGEPIVISDEDVVIVHAPMGYAIWPVNGTTWRDGFKGGYSPYDCRAIPFLEYQERIMSFGGSLTQDIMFHEFKLVNKSHYHTMPGIGPYDIEGFHLGRHAYAAQLGDESNAQRWAWVDSIRMFFTYEESFTDAAMDGWTPLLGFCTLKSMPMIDPETGDSIEAPLATASYSYGRNGEGTWGSWTGNASAPGGKKYQVNTGLPEYQYIQDPERLPEHKGTMIPDISDFARNGGGQPCTFFGSHDLTLCPGEVTYFTDAIICAFPQGSDPPSLATTTEGLMIVAGKLFKNAMLASTLYPDFKMAKAPLPPNVKLIPGDHQVTITWDNVSMYSRDDFYDVLADQGNLNPDPQYAYREHDFEGYRLYRSSSGLIDDAVLLAQFDLKNGVILEGGIMPRMTKVIIDGQEMEVPSQTFFDTVGISEYDPDNGAIFGLGHDTGLRFSFVDRWEERGEYGKKPARAHRLTNGFRYFYVVTAYDWNGNSRFDMMSLESPLVFTEDNMTIPRADASSYSPAEIAQEVFELDLLDGAGELLSTEPGTNLVAGGIPLEESEVTNSLQNLYSTSADALLLDELMGGRQEAFFSVRVDSIIGEIDELHNPDVDPGYKVDFWNKVFVRLIAPSGQTLMSAYSMGRNEGDGVNGVPWHFILHPPPDSVGDGVAFNMEFDFLPYDARSMLYAPVEVEVGSTPPEDISMATGYNPAGGSVPVGMRAADIEMKWHVVDGGDSLTLTVYDRTHQVEIPYRPLYSAGWTFYTSQSRFGRLSQKPRAEITVEELDKAGVRPKIPTQPSRAGKPVRGTIFLSGFQVKFEVKTKEEGWEALLPREGDIWVLRTNYGGLPADSLGYLEPGVRPPVEGLTYRFRVKDDSNNPDDVRMDQIKVVPNPYIASDVWDQTPLLKRIAFINLPNRAVIRIYTVSGNLVQILRHEGTVNAYDRFWKGGQEYWNMRNRFNMLVASGWYIWHVTDLDTGKSERGKFAIIQ